MQAELLPTFIIQVGSRHETATTTTTSKSKKTLGFARVGGGAGLAYLVLYAVCVRLVSSRPLWRCHT